MTTSSLSCQIQSKALVGMCGDSWVRWCHTETSPEFRLDSLSGSGWNKCRCLCWDEEGTRQRDVGCNLIFLSVRGDLNPPNDSMILPFAGVP